MKRKKPASKTKTPRETPDLTADTGAAPRPVPPQGMRGVDRSSSKTRVSELTWSQFDRKVQALARSIHAEFRPDAVVGIAHGGVFVGGALARALGCEFFPVRIGRRSRDRQAWGKPKQLGEIPRELKGKKVLLVDDVASSGDTLQLAISLTERVGAKAIKTASLIQREEGYEPDWTAVVTRGLVLFPWDYEPLTEDVRFADGTKHS